MCNNGYVNMYRGILHNHSHIFCKHKTAYEIDGLLEFIRVLFRPPTMRSVASEERRCPALLRRDASHRRERDAEPGRRAEIGRASCRERVMFTDEVGDDLG